MTIVTAMTMVTLVTMEERNHAGEKLGIVRRERREREVEA